MSQLACAACTTQLEHWGGLLRCPNPACPRPTVTEPPAMSPRPLEELA